MTTESAVAQRHARSLLILLASLIGFTTSALADSEDIGPPPAEGVQGSGLTTIANMTVPAVTLDFEPDGDGAALDDCDPRRCGCLDRARSVFTVPLHYAEL